MANGSIKKVAGDVYTAAWIAESSSTYATNLTDLIYLDSPGTYIAIVTCPIVSSGSIPIRIAKISGDAELSESYVETTTYAQLIQPVKVLTRSGFVVRAFSGISTVFSYIDRGSLQFIKIA